MYPFLDERGQKCNKICSFPLKPYNDHCQFPPPPKKRWPFKKKQELLVVAHLFKVLSANPNALFPFSPKLRPQPFNCQIVLVLPGSAHAY